MTEPSGWMGAFFGIGGLAGGLLYVRRQLSRDKVEGHKDRAEAGLISRLQSERDQALAEAQNVRAQRTADAAKIAHLESELSFAEREIGRMMREIKRAVRGLPKESREFLDTNFSMLADVELDEPRK
jgi:uncharacterized membrane protein